MGQYLHNFATEAAFTTAYNNDYTEPWVSLTKPANRVDYNKSEYEKLLETPLTFEIIGDGDIVWKSNKTTHIITLEYKKNDGEWTSITSDTDTSAPSIPVVNGDTVQFRGNNTTISTDSSLCYFRGTTCNFIIKGNIMSLLNDIDFSTLSVLTNTFTFASLFADCTGLTDASELLLPATTLADYCYQNMFYGCTNLASAPELPATTLATYCYRNMFKGCTNLTTVPSILPATNLSGCDFCYAYMFHNCTSLAIAPELPATTLVEGCYYSMFRDCRSLNYIKCLATDISARDCTYNWVNGVASTGTFVKNSNMSSWTTGNSGIPLNWTVTNA